MSDLAATQRWMQDVITDPHAAGPADGALAPEAVVRGTRGLGARERLALYGRTYQRRLAGCLRDGYPGLRHALGDELFDDFALEYVGAKPSRSYTLASLGADWPEHLEATRPDRDLAAHERERWPDFLIDLARLERTFSEVYDGDGVEGERLPAAADLPSAADFDARGSDAIVTQVACLRLLRSRFPVSAYLVAVRRGEDPPLPAPAPSFVAVSRRDYVVTITILDGAAHALLSQLAAGTALIAAAVGAGVGLPAAWRLLGEWADRGLIAAIDITRPNRPVAWSTRGAV
jgi:hypothetical protein